MASKGKTYKNHLATMELWKTADMKKEQKKVSFFGEERIVGCLCRCAAEKLEKEREEHRINIICAATTRLLGSRLTQATGLRRDNHQTNSSFFHTQSLKKSSPPILPSRLIQQNRRRHRRIQRLHLSLHRDFNVTVRLIRRLRL